MKVLMLTDRLTPGGAETHIYELARGLLARGIQVELASSGGAFVAKCRAAGIPHHTLPPFAKRPLALLRARAALLALMRQGHYDLLHAHARLPAFLAAGICKKLHVPMVTTAHWVFDTGGLRRYFSCWGIYTLAVSLDIQDYLKKAYGLDGKNIYLTRNGIDTDVFRPKEKDYHARLVHVSRLDSGRAATAGALLRLSPALYEAGCTSLTIVGGGDQYEALYKKAEQINRHLGQNFIRMVGSVTHVLPYLSEGDIAIGVSRAALEAMACGLPVILAGDEGYLSICTPDVAKIAEASNFCCRGAEKATDAHLLSDIKALLQNQALREACGKSGAAYVKEKYSTGAMAEDAIAIYHRALIHQKKPPIILCGYYGFDNLGDEAVLSALLGRLRREGFGRITVLSENRRKTEKAHGVKAKGRLSLLTIWQAGRKKGIFLLGGGNLLQDETSRRSLRFYTAYIRLARLCGCRIWVMGGLGRLSPYGMKLSKKALRLVEACFARTPQDVEQFSALLCHRQTVHLLPDVALWTTGTSALPKDLPPGRFLLVCLHRNTPSSFITTIADACQRVAQKKGLQTAVFYMQQEKDQSSGQHLAERLHGVLILPSLTPEEIVTFLRERCACVLATRLHMLIFSAIAGVPAVTLHDEGKISAFAAYAAACAKDMLPSPINCLSSFTEKGTLYRALYQATGLRQEEKQQAFIHALRLPGEDFLFTDFL